METEEKQNIILILLEEYKKDMDFLRECSKTISVINSYDVKRLEMLYKKYFFKEIKIDKNNVKSVLGDLMNKINGKMEKLVVEDYLGLIKSEEVEKVYDTDFSKTTKIKKELKEIIE